MSVVTDAKERHQLHKVHLIPQVAVHGTEVTAIVIQMSIHVIVITADRGDRIVTDVLVVMELRPATNELETDIPTVSNRKVWLQ